MNKYKAALGPILGLLSASIWALAFSNVKIALKTFGPSEIAALRFFVSGLLGLLVLIFSKQKTWNAKEKHKRQKKEGKALNISGALLGSARYMGARTTGSLRQPPLACLTNKLSY